MNLKKHITTTQNVLWKGTKITTFSTLIYFATLLGSDAISAAKSPRLESQQHAEQILKKKMKELGIENKEIKLLWDYRVSGARKVGQNQYELAISPLGKRFAVMDHELYHIADGHCDAGKNWIKYLFYDEPQAILYQSLGIKL